MLRAIESIWRWLAIFAVGILQAIEREIDEARRVWRIARSDVRTVTRGRP